MISDSFKKQWRLSLVRYYERDGTRVPDQGRTTMVINKVAKQFPYLNDHNFFNDINSEPIRRALRSQVSQTSNIVRRIVAGLEDALNSRIERNIIVVLNAGSNDEKVEKLLNQRRAIFKSVRGSPDLSERLIYAWAQAAKETLSNQYSGISEKDIQKYLNSFISSMEIRWARLNDRNFFVGIGEDDDGFDVIERQLIKDMENENSDTSEMANALKVAYGLGFSIPYPESKDNVVPFTQTPQFRSGRGPR